MDVEDVDDEEDVDDDDDEDEDDEDDEDDEEDVNGNAAPRADLAVRLGTAVGRREGTSVCPVAAR